MKGHEGLPGPPAHPLTLTKPRLLVSLHLDGQAEVCQFHCGPFAFAGQKQVLRLQGDSHQGSVHTASSCGGQGTKQRWQQLAGQRGIACFPTWVSLGTTGS